MGYELRVTRADWPHAASHPIAEVEWTAFAEDDPELRVCGNYSELDRTSGETADRPIYGVVEADGPSLLWSGGEVVVTGATEADIDRLKSLAEKLSAGLIGDDGEPY
jgi:hypothetical protein